MGDIVVFASAAIGQGAGFEMDQSGGTPQNPIIWPYYKAAFGSSGVQTRVDDVAGQRLPVKPIGPSNATQDAKASLVSNTDKTILVAGTRVMLVIFNPTSNLVPIYINFGAPAAADNSSIPIQPGGILRFDNPGNVPPEDIHCFCTANATVGCKWA